ncbi:MAG: apolipoprotein N-acyltransferase [Gammaproteobacteria bacterium]|nr:apolipoprotein N-acyltransferase [Gammaproteobacteria bacterium]
MQTESSSLNSILLSVLSGAVLSVAFLDYEASLLAWVGLVPMLFALRNKSVIKSFGLGFVAGLVLFACGKYWLVEFVELSKGLFGWRGWILAGLYWTYCAFLVAIVASLYRWLNLKTRLAPVLLLPAVYTAVSSLYPMIFHLRFSETQVLNLVTIQGVDLFGPAGLDALIVSVNAAIFILLSIISKKAPCTVSSVSSILLILGLVIGWFGYGSHRLASMESLNSEKETVKIGLVQPNEIPSLNEIVGKDGFSLSYPAEMALTEQLAANGADYVVWPEGRRKHYLDNLRVRNAFVSQINDMNIGLIFQDTELVRDPKSGKVIGQFNSALMLDGRSDSHQRYDKMKLIPFRETIPLIGDSGYLRPLFEGFIGRFLNELDRGQREVYFQHENLNFIPLICYETTFPKFVASRVESAIDNESELSRGTIIIGLSNDGWFGSNHQPYQHIYGSVLRAVENRLPLVHVANNGPSLVVGASGEVLFSSSNSNAGGYLLDVEIGDSSISSAFRTFPNALIYGFYLFLLIVSLRVWLAHLKRGTKQPD